MGGDRALWAWVAAPTARWAAPVATASAAGAALVVLMWWDPNSPGHYPPCPFLTLTGFLCPGCGSLRALHALAHGDVVQMVGLNALLPAGLALMAWAWLTWAGRVTGWWSHQPMPSSRHFSQAIMIVVVLFTVLRNVPTPPFAALAP